MLTDHVGSRIDTSPRSSQQERGSPPSRPRTALSGRAAFLGITSAGVAARRGDDVVLCGFFFALGRQR